MAYGVQEAPFSNSSSASPVPLAFVPPAPDQPVDVPRAQSLPTPVSVFSEVAW
jgi:hypothetical protein